MSSRRIKLVPRPVDFGKEPGRSGKLCETEYSLRETLQELDEWLDDERPMLPIETAISARFWLYRLLRHCDDIATCIGQPFTEEDLEKVVTKCAAEVMGQ
jgi:hypothetical protein